MSFATVKPHQRNPSVYLKCFITSHESEIITIIFLEVRQPSFYAIHEIISQFMR